MIEVKNISKSFGEIKAVNGVSFEVKKGEIVGLLGPNGAGKTTTMRMLTGYFYPDKGSIKIDGMNILKQPEEIRKTIGYMPESNPIYKDMLVEELLKFVLELRDIPKSEQKELIKRVVEETGIADVYYRPIGELSKGFKQRVGLAQALIHNPEILILDEPTEGLDPNQRNDIRKLIKKIGKEKTVILSTHVMQEVTAMCDRVIIIDNGKVIADGNPDELEKGNNNFVDLIVDGTGVVEELKKMKEVEDVETVSGKGKKKEYRVKYNGEDSFFEGLAKVVSRNKWTVYKLTPEKSSLEDVFYALTHKEMED